MNKISVNKLAEYLGSDALRRRRIIEDQKEPLEFTVTRYKTAKSAMIDYLKSGYNVVSRLFQKNSNKKGKYIWTIESITENTL